MARNKMINTYIYIYIFFFSCIKYLKSERKIIIVLYALSSPPATTTTVINGGATRRIRLFAFSAASHANPAS